MSATSATEAITRGLPGIGSTESMGRVQLNCAIHGPYMAVGMRYLKLRREVWSKCRACSMRDYRLWQRQQQQQAQHEREARHQAMVAETIEHAAIPERFKTRSLDNFEPRTERHHAVLELARAYVERWPQHERAGRWLVFAGEPGVGKSHIAIAILRALMPATVGQYITCIGMIQAVRATWARGSESTEAQVLRHFGSTPLLVVDEVGVQYGTEGEHTIIFDVLDRRYRDMRPTILLTNEDVEGFERFVGPRLWDRMKENTRWVQFDGGSYRKEARVSAYAAAAGERADHV